jgi:dynactin complex subunit
MTQTIITAAIGVATVAGAYLTSRLNRPRIEAEAKQIMGTAYTDLIGNLRDEVEQHRDQLAQLRKDLDYERKRNYQLEAWSKALTAQVIELGGVPVLYSDFKGAT